MATAPLAPPSDIGNAPPEVLEKYNAALDAQVKALDNRGNINFFNLAKAFANPGRTGSFAESFGGAMGEIGKQREVEEAQAIPIAQMRASLVGQQYQMQKEQESNKALMNALGGGNAADVIQSISTPQGAFGNPQLYQALVRAQMLAQPGTSAAAKIDKLLKTQQEQLELGIKQGTLDVARVASQFQYGPSSLNTPASSTKPAGTAVDNPNLTSGPARPQPTTAGSGTAEPAPAGNGMMGTPPIRPPGESADFHGTESQSTTSAAAPAATPAASTPNVAPKTSGGWTQIEPNVFKMEGTNRVERFAPGTTNAAIQERLLSSARAEHEQTLKLEAAQKEAEIKSQSEEKSKRGAPYVAQNATLAGYTYNTVKDSELKYKELIDLVRKNPDVVGTLVHQGPLYALLHSVQEGVRTPSGSLSLDVVGAINKLYQSSEQQSAARNIAQLISDLNQQVMKKGKDIFGPQISEYDAKKMSEPGFKTTDPAEFIIYLATKNDLLNRYMGKMADAQQDYFEVNPNASTGSFFNTKNKKSPYKSIVDEYADLNKQLIDASPYNRRGK
jgi:hypothetical protein